MLVDTAASLWGSGIEVIPVSEVHELLVKMHDILDKAVVNGLVIHLVFYYMFLILIPRRIMKSGLCSSPFFSILRTLFLLVRFAFIITLIGLWHRTQQQPSLGLSHPQTL